jgi:hypothetical protein
MSETNPPYLLQRRWFWLAVLGLACLIVGYRALWGGRRDESDDDYRPYRYVIPQTPVTEVEALPVAQADGMLGAGDLVLGVQVGDEARAYPLKAMNTTPRTKALNDVLGGRPILVTWCDQCWTGVVYERAVAGAPLTFRVYGSLWRDSFVIEDEQTFSQWSQWDGKARTGLLKGRVLERLPSVVTDWESWRGRHPHGSVASLPVSSLPAEQRDFDAQRYHEADDYVLVAGTGREAKMWDLAELRSRGVVNDVWNGMPVAAVYLNKSGTARLFSRSVGSKTLTLKMTNGTLQDRETGSTWDALSGQALEGALRGEQMPAVPSMVTARAVWRLFQQ